MTNPQNTETPTGTITITFSGAIGDHRKEFTAPAGEGYVALLQAIEYLQSRQATIKRLDEENQEVRHA